MQEGRPENLGSQDGTDPLDWTRPLSEQAASELSIDYNYKSAKWTCGVCYRVPDGRRDIRMHPCRSHHVSQLTPRPPSDLTGVRQINWSGCGPN